MNEKEILTIRLELERSLELNKLKEREYETKLDDVQNETRLKQKQIDKLYDEIKEVRFVNQTFKEEIDLKSRELKQIRNEFQLEMKYDITLKTNEKNQIIL